MEKLAKAVKWLEKADFEAKIVVAGVCFNPKERAHTEEARSDGPLAGNHDITLDSGFYHNHGLYFHNKNPQRPEECLSLLTESPSITYLNHESATIRLKSSPSGPGTEFRVFGSPYSPRHGLWAFSYDAPSDPFKYADLTSLWEQIPLDTDIVVTHTPPRSHRDETDERRASGCEALRQALWRVRPSLAVCGHVHEGRGAERVVWDLTSRNVRYAEKHVTPWQDPGAGQGSKKASVVDLTGRRAASLANDGSPSATSPTARKTLRGPLGLGGDTSSARCDGEALAGRMGRLETCVVNAAITKGRYPHVGGKMLNKPIVVDLNLPVSEEDA